jgi:hypothetical protein
VISEFNTFLKEALFMKETSFNSSANIHEIGVVVSEMRMKNTVLNFLI